MDVFVTGGTGHVGSAVVPELVRAGHQVSVLARSAASAARAEGMGAVPVAGDLAEPPAWLDTAARHGALVHAAEGGGGDLASLDRIAIDALLEATEGDGAPRHLVYTSGCWILGDTEGTAYEDAPTDHPAPVVSWRPDHERRVPEAAGGGLVTAVVRPGVVYGGHGSLTARLFRTAERDGSSRYVGDGANHWSLVHREDLAILYRLVLESRAGGIFHGVDGTPMKLRDVAAAASRAAGAGGRTRALPLEEAREEIGPTADALALDQRLEARRYRHVLGWRPSIPSFAAGAARAYAEWRAA